MKACSDCGKTYDELEFYQLGGGARRSTCRYCFAARYGRRPPVRRYSSRRVGADWRCCKCQQIKQLSDFTTGMMMKDGTRGPAAYCRECMKPVHREYAARRRAKAAA